MNQKLSKLEELRSKVVHARQKRDYRERDAEYLRKIRTGGFTNVLLRRDEITVFATGSSNPHIQEICNETFQKFLPRIIRIAELRLKLEARLAALDADFFEETLNRLLEPIPELEPDDE